MKKLMTTALCSLLLACGPTTGTVERKGKVGNCWWIKVNDGKQTDKKCISAGKWRKVKVGDKWTEK